MENDEQYQIELNEFMKRILPTCPYEGLAARWAWKVERERLFKEEYINKKKKE